MQHPAIERYFDLLQQRERLLTHAVDEISETAFATLTDSLMSLFGIPWHVGKTLFWVEHYAAEVIAKGENLVQTPGEVARELERYESFKLGDLADTNEAAFALTHMANINGEAPAYRQMARQYEKRIQTLTQVLHSVMILASDGLLKGWPWSRRRVLKAIASKAGTTVIPKWHEMEV